MKKDKYFKWFYHFCKKTKTEVFDYPVHKRIRGAKGFELLKIFVCRLPQDKLVHWSTGAAWAASDALLRSSVELVERYLATNYFGTQTTSGVACHFSLKAAQKNAFYELLERDAFFSSFLLGKRFEVEKRLSATAKKKKAALEKNKIFCRFFRLPTLAQKISLSISVLSLKENSGPYFIGFKCHPDRETAQVGALLEAIQYLNEYLIKAPKPKKASVPRRNMSRKQVQDLYLKKAYYDQFASRFLRKEKNVSRKSTASLKINYDTFHTDDTIFYGCDLFLARANHPLAQLPFIGRPEPIRINFERLLLSKPNLKIRDIPWAQVPLFF